MTCGPIVVDCAALQSPTSRGRGIGRFAQQWLCTLEALRPDLVGQYLLDPGLPPPGEIEELLSSGKVSYRGVRSLPPSSRIYHCLSPLDTAIGLETLWPRPVYVRGLRMTATVYDLIPALEPERELQDPFERCRYRTRLELVRAADQLQVLSEKVARDLVAVLGIAPARIRVVGAAPAVAARDSTRLDVVERQLGELGMRAPFVLYPTGSHPRKNNEALLDAWGALAPDCRTSTQLVLVGDLPDSMVHHLRTVAERLGFGGALLLTGTVEDDVLAALQRRATVVCFPSLDEGFGLPVAEALAVGTAVIGSDRPPLDEQLPAEARFDPTTTAAITRALERAITDASFRDRILSASRRPRSPEDVARASAAGFDALLHGGASPTTLARRRVAPRRRIAFVSPFPPTPSGVANYSYRLLEAVQSSSDVAVDVYLDGPTEEQRPPPGAHVRDVRIFTETERALGGYDELICTLGNSHFHHGALTLLRERSGIVLAHDVRLSNLYRYEVGAEGIGGGLSGTIRSIYGDAGLPDGLGVTGITADEEERFGLLLAREAIAASKLFLVSSEASAALALVDAGADLAPKVRVLPFAFSRHESLSGGFVDEERPSADRSLIDDLVDSSGPLLCHFGLVDEAKRPFVLLEGAALVRERFSDLRLAFVGLASTAITDALRERADALGMAEAMTVTGAVTVHDYQRALDASTIAVQLRSRSNGEASAAIGECLASGLATVVSDLGWTRELPDDAVARVARFASAEDLAAVLTSLLGDRTRRAALQAGARREAERRTFEKSAQALLELAFGSR